jgi:probable dihydroxyacetone kinase regulator
MADLTKKALAQSLKQLMLHSSLAKISVQDVVEQCGVNRQTFYYHFKDKYDLVNWIYQTEAVEALAGFADYSCWQDCFLEIFRYLAQNRAFYVNALNTPGQNAFDGYLFEATHQLVLGVLEEIIGETPVTDVDKHFIADFYTHAFVGITVQWVRQGMKQSPEVMIDHINAIVEGSMARAIIRCTQESLQGPARKE